MQTVVVAIIEQDSCRLGMLLEEDTALTLVAVASEDPECWDEIVDCWPRYRTTQVPESAESLAIECVDRDTARAALEQHESWVVIDLVRKRILTGRGTQTIGRDAAFAMVVDESGDQHCPLSVHLAPWWEMLEHTDPGAADRDRESPLAVPRIDREMLFGSAMIEDLAGRILSIVESDEWAESGADDQERARYQFTVRVHRDWLMTPRQDLDGLMPRQMLHGGIDWIDHLAWAQWLRLNDGGRIVALPTSISSYDKAPMGREEVAMYFDLCRELIGAGWEWCVAQKAEPPEVSGRLQREQALVAFLEGVRDEWLNMPHEGGSPPRFVIECSRRRVPRGAGVAIDAMSEREPEEHVIDCNCPICNMMADGVFGTAFVGIDGHHLELDDEFAFSLHATREEWEEKQREYAEMSAEFDRKQREREARGESEPDPFASAWSGHISDDPLPGDSRGHLTLAFLLAEIVGILESADAPREHLQQLNERFNAFRRCDRDELPTCGSQLKDHLEVLARDYPELVSRVADLQSRIDEHIRSQESDDDVPF